MNTKQTRAGLPANDYSAIERRLGSRLAGALTVAAESLPGDVTERLRFAREQALQRARVQQRALASSPSSVLGVSSAGVALLAGFAPWWSRLASVLPLLVLVGGLLVIDRWSTREQVLAAAEIDSQLLSDSLPPDAYSDPGFAEFLRSPPPPQ